MHFLIYVGDKVSPAKIVPCHSCNNYPADHIAEFINGSILLLCCYCARKRNPTVKPCKLCRDGVSQIPGGGKPDFCRDIFNEDQRLEIRKKFPTVTFCPGTSRVSKQRLVHG